MRNNSSLKRPILLWGLGSLFFAFQFVLRLSIGILREEILQKFAIDTITFGTLAGYYYLGYSGMQIPIGIMLDRFNVNLVIFISIIITLLGTLTFVVSSNWEYLILGRFLTGAGSAAGFLGVAKITKLYFPPRHHSFLLGLSFTFGLSGAVFGVTPMKILFNHFGYTSTFYALTIIGLIIASTILAASNNTQIATNNVEANSFSYTQLFSLLFNPTILIIGLCGGLMVGALEGFADIWAMPFFKYAYQMSDIDSSIVTSFVYIGMCFGGPALALLAKFCKSAHIVIVLTGLLTIAIFSLLFYFPSMSFTFASCLMLLLGICCCYQVLIFTVVSTMVDSSLAGIAIAIVNCVNMACGHLFHTLISILIQYNWDGSLGENQLPLYSRQDLIIGNSVIPIGCLIGCFGIILLSIRKNRNSSPL